MRTGWYREVHVKSPASHKFRVLLNNRRCLLDKRLDIDSQIRGTIRAFGLKAGKVSLVAYEERIRELIGDDTEMQAYIFPMLAARRELISQTTKLEKLILDYVKGDEVCRRLMTVPGVGPLTALAFKTFVDFPGLIAEFGTGGENVFHLIGVDEEISRGHRIAPALWRLRLFKVFWKR